MCDGFFISSGTGKTHALSAIIRQLHIKGKNLIVCGATGLSSIVLKESIGIADIKVQTVNSAFGLMDGR
mgnify:FL=1